MIDGMIEIPIDMYENDGFSVDECRGTLDVTGAEDECEGLGYAGT